VQLSVLLKDIRQGKVIWSDIINGKSEVTFGVFSNVRSKFEEAINLVSKTLWTDWSDPNRCMRP